MSGLGNARLELLRRPLPGEVYKTVARNGRLDLIPYDFIQWKQEVTLWPSDKGFVLLFRPASADEGMFKIIECNSATSICEIRYFSYCPTCYFARGEIRYFACMTQFTRHYLRRHGDAHLYEPVVQLTEQ